LPRHWAAGGRRTAAATAGTGVLVRSLRCSGRCAEASGMALPLSAGQHRPSQADTALRLTDSNSPSPKRASSPQSHSGTPQKLVGSGKLLASPSPRRRRSGTVRASTAYATTLPKSRHARPSTCTGYLTSRILATYAGDSAVRQPEGHQAALAERGALQSSPVPPASALANSTGQLSLRPSCWRCAGGRCCAANGGIARRASMVGHCRAVAWQGWKTVSRAVREICRLSFTTRVGRRPAESCCVFVRTRACVDPQLAEPPQPRRPQGTMV
jgi:hypothetical protein